MPASRSPSDDPAGADAERGAGGAPAGDEPDRTRSALLLTVEVVGGWKGSLEPCQVLRPGPRVRLELRLTGHPPGSLPLHGLAGVHCPRRPLPGAAPEVDPMTLVSEDIAATRRAVLDLERRAASLTRHYGDTVDARRLLADVGRLAADLELLCGEVVKTRPASPSPPPSVPTRQIIPDSSYTDGFWMDAQDEGLGRTR